MRILIFFIRNMKLLSICAPLHQPGGTGGFFRRLCCSSLLLRFDLCFYITIMWLP